MTTATDTLAVRGARYLDRVGAILDPVAAAAQEIEAARQLPERIVKLLIDAGMFNVAVPESWGGLELDPMTQARGIELLSAADGSAGWCAMIGCDTGYLSAFLDDTVGRALFEDPTQASAFVVNPTGVVTPVDGGYRVTGRWPFASGCTHAKVFGLGGLVMTDAGPRMAAPGVPEIRISVIRAEEAQIFDTWTTTGVRGSGSHDVGVTDTFVPEERSFAIGHAAIKRKQPLYGWTMLFTAKLSAVPLGIARAAIDDVVLLAQTKRNMGNLTPIIEQSWLHTAVAKAETALAQARSFYYEALAEIWDSLSAGTSPSVHSRARLQLAKAGAMDRSLEVVDAMYRAAGSASLYARGTLDRRLRDVHTIAQHTNFSPGNLEDAGKVMLGLSAPTARMLQA